MDRCPSGNLVVPPWVECPGFFFNPADKTFIGFSPSVREYKIPDSVAILTMDQCKARAQTLTMKDIDGNQLTTEQIDVLVETIVTDNDIA